MGKFIDLTGQRFGKLVVIRKSEVRKNEKICWVCDCDCGNKNEIKIGQDLKRGHTKSCGHCNEKRVPGTTVIDLTGKIFGNLKVLSLLPERTENRQTLWQCECQQCKSIIVCREGDLKYYDGNFIKCDCQKKYSGEEKIKGILKENNILFIEQKSFPSCRFEDTKRLAHFDFFVEDHYLIEYDGIQHFQYRENTNGWNNEEHFNKTIKRDSYKNHWCLENSIPLIRIPYTHLKDIELEDLILESSQYLVTEEKDNE